jgi:hypothetical protein
MNTNDQLAQMIGPLSSDAGMKRRQRFHQGWWRAFVLCEDPGPHPRDGHQRICSAIFNGEQTGANFLSPGVQKAVEETFQERSQGAGGIINEDRLYNNLLSSQPLCFNFFGDMKSDPTYALAVLGALFPGVTKVSNTIFEYAPKANYTADNTAFDVAFEVETEEGQGLIGLECKYTDSFSQTAYDRPEYRNILKRSGAFRVPYERLIEPQINQLFRNQLIAESLVLNGEYDFSIGGLFCHPEDDKGLDTAREFQSFLKDGENKFRIITYWDLVDCVLSLDLSRARREFAMLLWARYIGIPLSQRVYERVG